MCYFIRQKNRVLRCPNKAAALLTLALLRDAGVKHLRLCAARI
jgi:hypothetical protein